MLCARARVCGMSVIRGQSASERASPRSRSTHYVFTEIHRVSPHSECVARDQGRGRGRSYFTVYHESESGEEKPSPPPLARANVIIRTRYCKAYYTPVLRLYGMYSHNVGVTLVTHTLLRSEV